MLHHMLNHITSDLIMIFYKKKIQEGTKNLSIVLYDQSNNGSNKENIQYNTKKHKTTTCSRSYIADI